MTLEEAAEIILANRPYIDCVNCDGKGWEASGMVTFYKCSSCHGSKKQLLQEYVMACNVLGLEVP